MSSDTASGSVKEEMEAARGDVMQCEKEIQSIKGKIRELGTIGGEEEPNALEVVALKTEGLPETAKPITILQLSSPVEEQTISKMFDPLEPTAEGSVAKFSGVEASTATLTITAKDADIPLGVSVPHDMAPFCNIQNVMQSQTQYIKELNAEIFPESSDQKPSEEGDESDKPVPVCTITFRLRFKPSTKDQREELYDLLNKASQKKSKALERLRKSASAVSRASAASSTTLATSTVKPGFLNKPNKDKEPSKLVKFYNRMLGPQSFVRKVFPAVKNYIIFFGAVALFHFRGQELALPPPV